MKLTVVRHTAVEVPKGVCYGQTDVPLAGTFREEAEAVAGQLAGTNHEAVFTSPLSRCVRLAEFCGYPQATRDARLMELNFGEWEMKRWDDITDPRLDLWFEDWLNVAATGGESYVDQRCRVMDFINEQRTNGIDDALIFTHGGVITHLLVAAGIITADKAFSEVPPYGSVVRIKL